MKANTSNRFFAEERRRDIVKLVSKKGKATVEELGKRYNVSLPTIRADLAEPEAVHMVKRTHYSR